ncbi:restriction endonuclease subunit S [Lactobacillus iners]|uniref:restriction endonuclease subunit S n=1 Tax=Lactobacillus iners TaxID=147802 RepID=UPI000C801CB3|nr:restriction endonuclease subunit S [Lactobacillus iners]MDK7317625.1 restriction endonuclease subunit S [Lactobacillus iners]PMC41348.1 restriction endonuclease subunit S [Lactobacillus iners]
MIELSKAAHYVSDKINVSSLKIEEYITTDNMIPNRGGVVDCESLPKAKRVTRYEPGDILISNIRPYFKKIWFSDRISGCSNDVIVFRANDENWNKKFLYYVLSQDSFFDFMMSGSNGTKMPRGNKKTIPEFLIPDFDIDKQIRIADILSAYDSLIENNQKQIKLLEEAAQRLYKEWFVDLRFPGYEDVKIVDGVPEGWKKERAECFFKITIGKTPPRAEKQWFVNGNNGIPWLSISDMRDAGTFIFKTREGLTEEAIKKHNMKIVPSGTIFVSFKLTVGRVAIATTEMCTNEAIAHFYVNDSLQAYTYCYLSNFEYDTLGNTSSISKAVNSKIIKAMPFIMPSQDIIENFSMIVSPILNEIKAKQEMCNYLSEARDRLLPKLMSGEIEV